MGWGGAIEALINDPDLHKSLDQALRGRSAKSLAVYKYSISQAFDDSVLEGLISAYRYDRTYFDKIVSSLGPLLEKLTSGSSAKLLSPDYFDINDERPIFEFMSAIQQGAVVYIGLDALSDPTVAGVVGASMFADLASIAGRIYKHGLDRGLPHPADGEKRPRMPRVAIHADDDLPESLAESAQDMKNSYSRITPENWYKPHDNWYQLSPILSGDLNTDSVGSISEGVTS